jgi:hypothetical protein
VVDTSTNSHKRVEVVELSKLFGNLDELGNQSRSLLHSLLGQDGRDHKVGNEIEAGHLL